MSPLTLNLLSFFSLNVLLTYTRTEQLLDILRCFLARGSPESELLLQDRKKTAKPRAQRPGFEEAQLLQSIE
jgi:hypothetical protein